MMVTELTLRQFWVRTKLTLDMIRFEHSVFALTFSLTGAMLAWRESGFATSGLWWKALWIVIAMVGARSAAMAFNRILDHEIDARNPRTRARHLPAGLLSRTFAWGFVFASAAVFLIAAKALNPLCFALAPVALGIVLFYSFTKRFTTFAHLVLGFSLGIAPAAAWIAVRGSLDPRIIWLTAAVTFRTAGFDIIYSCQDYAFDCEEGLFSVPRRFGIARALWMARALHFAMVACLFALVAVFHLGPVSIAGIAAILSLLIYEHRIVRADDLSRVDAAFFTMNGYVSVLFFLFWATDILWGIRSV
jgi:4-hydroxybenzoate polyprenyltransferase